MANITVTYDANGGSGTTGPQSEPSGTVAALTANTFTFTDKIFNGWNTAADGSGTSYLNYQSFTFTTNTTLYAQWGTGAAVASTLITTLPSSAIIYGACFGADGNIWAVGTDSTLPGAWQGTAWKITLAGIITEYPCPSTWNCQPNVPVLDTVTGIIWVNSFYFGGSDYATIDTSGTWTAQAASWVTQPYGYVGMTLFSSDGNLYGFCNDWILGTGLVKLNPSTVAATFTAYPLDPGANHWFLSEMREDASGNLWGLDSNNGTSAFVSLREINKTGSILNNYNLNVTTAMTNMIIASDGNFWASGDRYIKDMIMATAAGAVNDFPNGYPDGYAAEKQLCDLLIGGTSERVLAVFQEDVLVSAFMSVYVTSFKGGWQYITTSDAMYDQCGVGVVSETYWCFNGQADKSWQLRKYALTPASAPAAARLVMIL